jgi:hypothetical protein
MVRSIALLAVLFASTAAYAQQDDRRPALLLPLYASHIALQAADVHSTMLALKAGHVEGNPVMRGLSPAGMVGVKVAATAGVIVLTERLWKRHRIAAVSLMLVGNGALAVIAARNYQIARR